MLRVVSVLALARSISAATTPPGTGYSDADSCPPPEATPIPGVTTHSCSFCATTLTKAPLIKKDAAWQSVAFANHATETARLVEVDAAGRELPRGTINPGAEKTFRCQVGTTWRARRLETNEILLEHRVGAVRLVAEPPEDVHNFGVDDSSLQRRGKPPKPALPYKTSSHPRAPVSKHADGTVDYGDVGEGRHERRGGLPDAGVGITKTRAGRAAAEEAPLARRLGEREGEEVLYVIRKTQHFKPKQPVTPRSHFFAARRLTSVMSSAVSDAFFFLARFVFHIFAGAGVASGSTVAASAMACN